MENNTQSKQADKLIFSGLILFPIGLVVGLFVQNMANPRLGLSAHLKRDNEMMPIAGGMEETETIETLISFLLISLSLCMLAVCIIVLIGFYKHILKIFSVFTFYFHSLN